MKARIQEPTSTALPRTPCSLSLGIEEINRVHGTDFTLGQVVSYDAGKGRGRRLATITGHEDGFLKIMRDGDNYEYGALWDPGDILAENSQDRERVASPASTCSDPLTTAL